jgi:thioredoxin 1
VLRTIDRDVRNTPKSEEAKAVGKDVVVLNNDNWKQEVAEAKQPVLVDFWAEWCAPCRMIAPAVDALATTYAGRAKVAKLNIDESPEVANAFGVRSIPTLLVFREGRVVDAQIGAVPQSSIARMIESHLDPTAACAPRE